MMPFKKNNRGTTAIEFALILPFFAFFIFGIFDMGYYMFVHHTLQFATVEGVRLGMVGRTLNGANGQPLSRAASITQEIDNWAARGGIPAGAIQVSIFPITAAYGDPTGWTGEQNAGNPGDYMRVVTTYNCESFTPFKVLASFKVMGISLFGEGFPATITAQATYRNELF